MADILADVIRLGHNQNYTVAEALAVSKDGQFCIANAENKLVLRIDASTSKTWSMTGTDSLQNLAQVLAEGNDAGNQQIKNIADGTDAQDAAALSQLTAISSQGAQYNVNTSKGDGTWEVSPLRVEDIQGQGTITGAMLTPFDDVSDHSVALGTNANSGTERIIFGYRDTGSGDFSSVGHIDPSNGAFYSTATSTTVDNGADGVLITKGYAEDNYSDRSAIRDFETLADVVASTAISDGNVVSTKERISGNGGGGVWDVVLSSTVTENTYDIVQCTGVGTLSVVLRVDNAKPISLRAFGYVSGDVEPVLRFVLDKYENIALQNDSFTVGATIPIYSDMSITGNNVLFTDSASLSEGMFKFDDASNSSIVGVNFAAPNGSVVIDMDLTANQDNITIRKCNFDYTTRLAIKHGGAGYMTNNMVVDNCDFEGDGSTDAILYDFGAAAGATSDEPLKVTNCGFIDCPNALETAGSGNIYNTKFTDNVVLGSTGRCLVLYHARGALVQGNQFVDYVDAVWFDNYVNVKGNLFQGSTNDGVIVYNAYEDFSNNTVVDCGGNGVIVSVGSTRGSVQNNTIERNSLNGIRVSAAPRGASWVPASAIEAAIIKNNTIKFNGQHGILIDDIKKDGVTYGTLIKGLDISKNEIYQNGTSDVTSQNIYCGIKYDFFHTSIPTTMKIFMKYNTLSEEFNDYAGNNNQYNGIIMNMPNSGSEIVYEVMYNTLRADTNGVAFSDTRRYGKRTFAYNCIRGSYDLAPLGIRNTFGNIFIDENATISSNVEGGRIMYGSAAPTSGTYNRGDVVIDSTPSAGGYTGWVCVTAGTPGTWEPYGYIGSGGTQKMSKTLNYIDDSSSIATNLLIGPVTGQPCPDAWELLCIDINVHKLATNNATSTVTLDIREVTADGTLTGAIQASSGSSLATTVIGPFPNSGGVDRYSFSTTNVFGTPLTVGSGKVLILVVSANTLASGTGITANIIAQEA